MSRMTFVFWGRGSLRIEDGVEDQIEARRRKKNGWISYLITFTPTFVSNIDRYSVD